MRYALGFHGHVGPVALANTRDAHHTAAIAARRKLSLERSRFFTTQWVLTEFLGSMAHQTTRPAALRIVDRILASPRTACITANDSPWTAALDLYRARPDKEWSLVDCSSMLVCRQHAIQSVLNADRHFAQAGFEVLL